MQAESERVNRESSRPKVAILILRPNGNGNGRSQEDRMLSLNQATTSPMAAERCSKASYVIT